MSCAPLLGSSPIAPTYRPRRPESTVLYQTLQAELETFLDGLETTAGASLPWFVRRELFEFLECGIPAFGFLRVHCSSCQLDRIVPFSCKRRGFCPSCGGRRMADLAAHWVDRVLPDAPVRQWVLTLPFQLRYRLAFDHELMSKVLNRFIRVLFCWQRRRARQLGLPTDSLNPGSVTAIQRFGSALNLNPHLHSLLFEGLFVETDKGVRFQALPPPTDDNVADLVRRIRNKILQLLQREWSFDDLRESDEPALDACRAASVKGRIAFGARSGKRVERVGPIGPSPWIEHSGPLCASIDGFSLHADTLIPEGRHERLERLCRYIARPPFSHDRLEQMPDGTLTYRLKTRWSDGTTHIRLTPGELIERLAALVPYPRKKLIRYHGVLAPNARLRSQVVPSPTIDRPTDSGKPRPTMPWSVLLRRVFLIDVLSCPRCGADSKIISAITRRAVIEPFLQCLGLPSTPPVVAGPRAPP